MSCFAVIDLTLFSVKMDSAHKCVTDTLLLRTYIVKYTPAVLAGQEWTSRNGTIGVTHLSCIISFALLDLAVLCSSLLAHEHLAGSTVGDMS